MTTFKIQTPQGFFARPEKIGPQWFPANRCAGEEEATVYLSLERARTDIQRFRLHHAQIVPGTRDFAARLHPQPA